MNYRLDTLVNNQEANALKEMIFKRIKERSDSSNDSEYGDVMDLARSSFVSENNPFSKIVSQNEEVPKNISEETQVKTNQEAKETGIGFPMRELKTRQNGVIVEKISAQEVQNTMQQARESLSSKKSFMGALNFLNSQAAVSLIRTRADKFEVVV